MFEKIARHRRLIRNPTTGELVDWNVQRLALREDTVVPGEGVELLSTPVSPHDQTFVRSEPPSTKQLFEQMVDKGIQPTVKMVCFLMRNAPNLSVGIQYLRSLSGTEILLSSTLRDEAEYLSVPQSVFFAFIGLLCRFPHAKASIRLRGIHESQALPGWTLHRDHLL
ncbi:hypothetical protein LTS18_001207, partial [Coniosporium uncinatum]